MAPSGTFTPVPVGNASELVFERNPYGEEEDSEVATPIAELVSTTKVLLVLVGPPTELELDGKPYGADELSDVTTPIAELVSVRLE